ncbi:MAG: TIGR03016 family PEP-CTERM system-associated outer membrane protein [Rubrivivax sp.]|nr:MAG: TIGR03016 family PEP-CTERM system-associated outer membrane protein [Rubrivivax sp.]
MATMRREPCAIVVAVLGGLLPGAHAQKLEIKPALNVLATATTNASDTGSTPSKDLVISTSPELSVSYTGARARIEGQIKVDHVHFTRNKNDDHPDRTLPSGGLLVHTDLVEQWGGLDASVQTRQTPATLLTRQSATPGVTDSYTTTLARIAPFIEHAFSANTRLAARFERSVIQSDEATPGLAQRPDSHLSRHVARLERQPVPLGASLEWSYQDTQDGGLAESTLKDNAVRGSVSYAVNEQVHAGLILGRETVRVPQAQQSDTIRGANLVWRPNERATLDATVERRFFGTGWKVDWNHRMKSLVWGIASERDASTYASSLSSPFGFGLGAPSGTGSVNPIGSSTGSSSGTSAGSGTGTATGGTGLGGFPSAGAPGATTSPVAAQSVYSLSASLRQALQGRLVIMGLRNTLTFAGGVNKTGPLPLRNVLNPGANTDQTQERYLDTEFNRRLSPNTTLSAGVRWGLTNVVSPTSTNNGRSRNVMWRSAINTRLSPMATATVGLRHQTTQGNQTNASDESALYVGLGYRY